MTIKVGDKFRAVVKLGPHSKTLRGEEGAGRDLGIFVATRIKSEAVESYGRTFNKADFKLIKIKGAPME